MKKTGIPAVLLLLMTGLASCYNDKASELYPAGSKCDTATVTYSATLRPIVSQNCAFAGCHDASTMAGGYDLSAYAGLQTVAQSGRLHGAINHLTGFSPMPKNTAKLDDCTIAKFDKWIAAGAPNN